MSKYDINAQLCHIDHVPELHILHTCVPEVMDLEVQNDVFRGPKWTTQDLLLPGIVLKPG